MAARPLPHHQAFFVTIRSQREAAGVPLDDPGLPVAPTDEELATFAAEDVGRSAPPPPPPTPSHAGGDNRRRWGLTAGRIPFMRQVADGAYEEEAEAGGGTAA